MKKAKVRHYGFSLIEMTLVMLIIGIILIAMTPVMTSYTKKQAPDASLSTWINNKQDGIYTDRVVGIGRNVNSNDVDSLLSISRNFLKSEIPNTPAISFTRRYEECGSLIMDEKDNIGLGKDNFVWMGKNSMATRNIAIGTQAMNKPEAVKDKEYYYNIAIGNQAGYSGSTSQPTSGIGYGISSQKALRNVFIGYQAGYNALWGEENTHIGNTAGHSHPGNGNTFIGPRAGSAPNNSGTEIFGYSDNLYIGFGSGADTKSTNPIDPTANPPVRGRNIAIGRSALESTRANLGYSLDGSNAIAIGTSALKGTTPMNVDITDTIAIGARALTLGIYAIGSVSNSIYIGLESGSNQSRQYSTCIGNACQITENYSVKFKSTKSILLSADNVYGFTSTFNITSDKRLKNIISPYDIKSTDYKKINTYLYTLKDEPQQGINIGIIAQEVKNILKTAIHKGNDRYYEITPDELIYATVVVVQKIDKLLQEQTKNLFSQTEKIQNLETLISNLEMKRNSVANENKNLEKEIEILDNRLSKIERRK